jgi:hypothetical protein
MGAPFSPKDEIWFLRVSSHFKRSLQLKEQLHFHVVTNTELHTICSAPTACGVTKISQYIGTANGTKYYDVISENNVQSVDYLIVLQSFVNTRKSRGTATNPCGTPAALQKSKNELHEFEQYTMLCLRN